MSARIDGRLRFALFPFLFLAQPVFADENGLYAGASIGHVSRSGFPLLSIDPRDVGHVGGDSALKIFVGLRPFNPLAFELSYADFGRQHVQVLGAGPAGGPGAFQNPIATFDSRAVSISALGVYSLPSVELFGRLGVARWQSDSLRPPSSVHDHRGGTDPSYGIGAQMNLPTIGLRVEYEGFKIASDTTKLLSFGVVYRFR